MGFYINEEIETKLHWKDVTLIGVAINNHIERYGDKIDDEQKERMLRLTNRLHQEMYDNPDNNKPNSH